jgi:hypothetical protein
LSRGCGPSAQTGNPPAVERRTDAVLEADGPGPTEQGALTRSLLHSAAPRSAPGDRALLAGNHAAGRDRQVDRAGPEVALRQAPAVRRWPIHSPSRVATGPAGPCASTARRRRGRPRCRPGADESRAPLAAVGARVSSTIYRTVQRMSNEAEFKSAEYAARAVRAAHKVQVSMLCMGELEPGSQGVRGSNPLSSTLALLLVLPCFRSSGEVFSWR